MKALVLLPTYNEKDNIQLVLEKIFNSIPGISVLVVDDNSPDGTASQVKDLQQRWPQLFLFQRERKEGLGKAFIATFKKVLVDYSNFEAVVMMDADLSHDPKYIPEMLRQLERYDVVVGSRYISGGGTEGWELWRRALSYFGNVYCRFITRLPVHDCTAGFNCIRFSLLRRLVFDELGSFTGYAFEMALKYSFWRKSATFKEIPIIFKNRSLGKSKMSNQIIREGIMTPWRLIFTHSRTS